MGLPRLGLELPYIFSDTLISMWKVNFQNNTLGSCICIQETFHRDNFSGFIRHVIKYTLGLYFIISSLFSLQNQDCVGWIRKIEVVSWTAVAFITMFNVTRMPSLFQASFLRMVSFFDQAFFWPFEQTLRVSNSGNDRTNLEGTMYSKYTGHVSTASHRCDWQYYTPLKLEQRISYNPSLH